MAADHTLEGAIEGLKKFLSEKEAGLKEAVAEKIQKLTSELERLGVVDGRNTCTVNRIGDGFMDFYTNNFLKCPSFYEELAKGQQPKFLVFGCSDSRVSPTYILKFLPGEAFMARNIANLVPSFDLDKGKNSGMGAIIEYAVTALKVENILVIGHSSCGGIQRLMTMDHDHNTSFDFIDDWVKIATPAKDFVKDHNPNETPERLNELCEKVSVNFSLKNLKSYPYVRDGVERKSLNLMGGYYDFVKGEFSLWCMDSPQRPIYFPPRPERA